MKKIFGLLAGLFLLAGCTKTEPVTQEMKDMFTVDIEQMGTRTVTLKVTPKDTGLSYLGVILDKASYESMKDNFAEKIIAGYTEQNVPIEMLVKAGVDRIVGEYLAPGMDVVVGVFGCEKDGTITTEPIFKFFKMADQEENLIDCTFEIEVTNIKPASAKIHITPSNPDVMYVVLPGSKSVVDSYGGDLLTLAQVMVEYFEGEGTIIFDDIDSSESLQMGETSLDASGLLGGDEQVVVCFAVNEKGEVLSDLDQFGYEIFETPYPPKSNCEFDFQITDLSFNSCTVATVPSKPYVTHYTSVVLKRFIDTRYPTEENKIEFMNSCIMNDVYEFEGAKENFNVTPGTGTTNFKEIGTLVPEEEYLVFAFSAAAGRPTSELFLSDTFKAKSFEYKSGGDAEVTMDVLAIRDGALYGGSYAGYGFIDLLYHYNEACVEYYVAMPPLEEQGKWESMAEDDLKKAIILSLGSNQHTDNQGTWFWPLQQYAPFYMVGEDKDGQFGKITKTEVMCTLGRSMSTMLPDRN